jgi:hypothetical protein
MYLHFQVERGWGLKIRFKNKREKKNIKKMREKERNK